jgi:predicted DNA binding CopG/RHH family protein
VTATDYKGKCVFENNHSQQETYKTVSAGGEIMAKRKKTDLNLEEEEQEILEALELGKVQRVENFEEEKAFAERAAENFFKKNARLNIRISTYDLKNLKRQAAYKGLPYQTFVASMLHEIAAGHLTIERKSVL